MGAEIGDSGHAYTQAEERGTKETPTTGRIVVGQFEYAFPAEPSRSQE